MLFVRSSHVETASWQRPHAVYFQLSVEISIVINLVLHCCTFWMVARSDPIVAEWHAAFSCIGSRQHMRLAPYLILAIGLDNSIL